MTPQEWVSLGCVATSDKLNPYSDVVTIGGVQCIIFALLRIVPPLVVIAAVVMIIYSGIRMIMSPDNPKEAQAAQQTLTFAIIGLIGLGLAWVILILIQNFTGANVTQFQIIQP